MKNTETVSKFKKTYQEFKSNSNSDISFFTYLFGSEDDFAKQQELLKTATTASKEFWKLAGDKEMSKQSVIAQLDKECVAWQSLDDKTKKYIRTASDAESANEILTASFQTQSVAATICSKAVAGLKTALVAIGKTALVWAFIEGINLLASAVSDYKHKEEKEAEAEKERIEQLKESIEAQEEYIEQLKDITSQYEELGNVVSKTEEQKQTLADLQDQLVEKFGSEASSIDLVNGKYEEQLELLEQLNAEEAKKAYDASLEVVDNLKAKTEDNITNNLSLFDNNEKLSSSVLVALSQLSYGLREDVGLLSIIEDGLIKDNTTGDTYTVEEKILELLEEAGVKEKDLDNNEFQFFSQLLSDYDTLFSNYGISLSSNGINIVGMSSQDKISSLDFLREYLYENTSSDTRQEDWFKNLVSRISELNTYYQNEVNEYEAAAKEQIENYLAYQETENGLTYNDLLSTEMTKNWGSKYSFIREYKDFVSEILEDFSGDKDMLEQYLQDNLYEVKIAEFDRLRNPSTDIDYENFSDIVDAYSEKIDELKDKVSEYDDYIDKIESGSLTYSDRVALLQLHPELVGVDDLREALINLRDEAIGSLVDELRNLNIPDSLKGDVEELINVIESLSDMSLSDLSSLIEKQYDKEIDRISDQVSELEKLKSEEEEYYQEKIDKLKAANEEQERANELEEAYQELEKARTQKTLKVWRSGVGWTYETDKSTIEEAQENLESLKQEIEIEELEEAKDAVSKKYDEQIDALEDYQSQIEDFKQEYTDFVTSLSEQYDKQYLEEHDLTLKLEGDLKERKANVEEYTNKMIESYSNLYYATVAVNELLSSNSAGSTLADSSSLGIQSKLNIDNSNSLIWAWSDNSLLNSMFPCLSSLMSKINNVTYNFSFGNVVANDPASFEQQMSNYVKSHSTQSIIK